MSDRDPAPLRGHTQREHSSEAGVIVATPGVVGGRPRLAGTRISTACLYGWHKAGDSVDAIIEAYPHLTRADVLAAVAFELGRRYERRKRKQRGGFVALPLEG